MDEWIYNLIEESAQSERMAKGIIVTIFLNDQYNKVIT